MSAMAKVKERRHCSIYAVIISAPVPSSIQTSSTNPKRGKTVDYRAHKLM
jgi:hypothetical protein